MPGLIRCPSCGQEINSDSRFCVHCATRICPGCHGPVPPRAAFCPNCGFAVGPGMPGTSEQPTTPVPPPRSFPYQQGGIIGPQPTQQPSHHETPPYPYTPSYPQAPSYQTPGSMPETPIPRAEQPTGASTTQSALPYVSAQQPSASSRKTFADTGPILVRRRFPPALAIILVIAVIAIAGFAIFKIGWLEAPLNTIQEFISGIELPDWLPSGSKDTTPPVISEAEASNITESSAIITWQTDEPATSEVIICEGNTCEPQALEEDLITDHSINLSNLKPNTAYHFSITCKDKSNNEAFAEGEFSTLAPAGVTTMTISAIKTSDINDISATITWATDKPATSQVEYGTTNAYGSITSLDDRLTTNHSVSLTGLKPVTNYHFKVKSKDDGGTEATSVDQTFTTLRTASTVTETGPEVGKLAPDFTLLNLDGEQMSLSEQIGKLVIVNFWQDVQQSRNELDKIQAVYDTYPKDKLTILAVSWKQSPQTVQTFLASKSLTFPILIDESGNVGSTYNVTRCPVTIFIDSNGVIRDIKEYPATLKSTTQIESILNSMQ